jgi:hypothetical protein
VAIRFRPTLWPGSVIPLTPLRPVAPRNVEVKGEWIVWEPLTLAPCKELPPDFYLRELMSIEPSDLEGAAELMRTHGRLFDFNQEDLDEEDRGDLSHVPEHPPLELGEEGFHADDVKRHLERAQSSIKTWLALQTDGGLEERLDTELTEEYFQAWVKVNTEIGWRTGLNREDFRKFMHAEFINELESTLNAALSGISVGISFRDQRHHRSLTIYSASFLQLYNHMAEGATIRYCANEPCGRAFVRQRGRARFEQHRTEGVKYCSRECARAQAQRKLRRRKRMPKQ